MSFVFIPNHGIFFKSLVSKSLCEDIIKTKDFSFIWNYVKKCVPLFCNGRDLIGPGKIELIQYAPKENTKTKKIYEPESYDEFGNCSTSTLFLYCNDVINGGTIFHSAPKKNIYFADPKARYYIVQGVAGNAVIITHQVPYQEIPIAKGIKYVLKIPILYKAAPLISTSSKKKVTFGKIEIKYIDNREKRKIDEMEREIEETERQLNELTKKMFEKEEREEREEEREEREEREIKGKEYEIPTPNGYKFDNVVMINKYGKTITLTPNFDRDSILRWNDVIKSEKFFQIESYTPPLYINTKKGRPPTELEDYCPNCNEIFPKKTSYKNCSGCLSPFVNYKEKEDS